MKRPSHLLANRDSLAGLAVVGVCAVAWWMTAGFDEVPAILSQNVPPTFFPRLVIGTAALLGGLLVVGGIRRRAREAADHAAADNPSTPRENAGGAALPPPVFWATAGLIAAAGVLVPLVGTLLTLGLVAIALPLLWGERRVRLVVALALGLPGTIYVVFTVALGVRFPVGQVWILL
ncbi:MAG: tripartite tricarboxylate transporter TctB family protein [Rhodospirillaceae bacterium]|nr:tripartite tricarboxylate transporter TctB family protein [Rhodospirillaceae bacterium]